MTEEAVVQRLIKELSSSTSYFFSLPHTGPITTWIGCKCQIVSSGKLQKLLGADPPILMFEMCGGGGGVQTLLDHLTSSRLKPTEALRCPIFQRGSEVRTASLAYWHHLSSLSICLGFVYFVPQKYSKCMNIIPPCCAMHCQGKVVVVVFNLYSTSPACINISAYHLLKSAILAVYTDSHHKPAVTDFFGHLADLVGGRSA